MHRCIRAAIVAMLLLGSLVPLREAARAQGNVNGTVYTSPTFDYQLQWSAPWFFIEETSDGGADMLVLYDGESDASFLFAFAPGVTLQDILDASGVEISPGVSDFEPMLDAQGVPIEGFNGDQEWKLFTGTQTLDDGSTIDFMQYFNLRSLEGGVILLMTSSTVSYFWDDASLQSLHDFADSVLVDDTTPTPVPTVPVPIESPTPDDQNGQRPGPDVSPTTEPDASPTDVPDVTTTPVATGDGEPAPAFAAGPWRIAVRAVDLGETIDYLGLGYVDGNQWIVVYADITNWSETDQQLDAASMTLVTAGGEIAPDAVNTKSTASLLGLEPANGSTVLVPAGASIRVALVYSIPVSETELILSVARNQLPLADAVGRQFDVTDLSTIATPPAGQSGTLSASPDDGTGIPAFVITTADGQIPVRLAGVEFPSEDRCVVIGGEASSFTLDGISGPVWLETDPAVTDPDTYYVWLDGEAEGRVLLNQFLIASGFVQEGDLPEASRFGAWLEQTEGVARSTGTGIWGSCD
jgi:hypothetical protein